MTPKPVSLSQLSELAAAAQLAVETVRALEALHAQRWQLATQRRAAEADLVAARLRFDLIFEGEEAECHFNVAAVALGTVTRALDEIDAQLAHVEPRVEASAQMLTLALAPMTGSSSPCRLPCYCPSPAHV